MRSAFVSAIDGYLKAQEISEERSKLTWVDVQDCLVLVSNFSTQTSYENQTKKAINNKFGRKAMTEFLKAQMESTSSKTPLRHGKDRRAGAHQQAVPRSPPKARLNIKKLTGSMDISNRVQKFVDCRTWGHRAPGAPTSWEGDSAMGAVKN